MNYFINRYHCQQEHFNGTKLTHRNKANILIEMKFEHDRYLFKCENLVKLKRI